MCIINSNPGLCFNGDIIYPEIKIQRNRFTFITGKSGCGKSTYLKMLNRMVLPNEGSIRYNGKEISEYPVLEYRRNVLLVPQEIFLLDATIRENFDFYYTSRGDKTISDEKIEEFLRICCLDFKAGDVCTRMSGGERQRVFLAIFLSMAVDVFLMDEPTAALDEKTSIELMQNFRKYCGENNITVVCISHSNKLVEVFADDIIKLGGDIGE